MKTGILTLHSFIQNARRIGGRDAQISTTGPVHDAPDLLMVFLHPSADGQAWENDQHQVVATVEQVRAWPLQGAVVFLGVCYGLENTAMQEALFQAGARAIVAGPGANFGGSQGVLAGADILAKSLCAALELGMGLEDAWATCQATLAVAVRQLVPGAADAQEFKLLRRPETNVPQSDAATPVEVTSPRSRRSWWGWLGGMVALIGLWLSLLFFAPNDPGLLTTFSSIAPPPTRTPTPTPLAKPTRVNPSAFYLTPEVYLTPYPTPYQPERAIVIIFFPLVVREYPEATPTPTPTVTLPITPELVLTGPATAYGGQALDYTVTVTGTGSGTHTIIATLPDGAGLVTATPSGYTQSGYAPVLLTWIEDDLGVWGSGTIRATAPEITTTTVITQRVRVLWGGVQVSDLVTTTLSP